MDENGIPVPVARGTVIVRDDAIVWSHDVYSIGPLAGTRVEGERIALRTVRSVKLCQDGMFIKCHAVELVLARAPVCHIRCSTRADAERLCQLIQCALARQAERGQ